MCARVDRQGFLVFFFLSVLKCRHTKGNLAGNPFPCLLLILGIIAFLGLWLLSPSPNPVDSKKVKWL